MSEVRVQPITDAQLEALLPLIAGYQRFYEAKEISDERNRAFFARFIAPSELGMLLGAWDNETLLGFATLYWHHSSVDAVAVVLMNDLFVVPEARGRGVGRALIDASLEVARERGAASLEWQTAPDNATAQRLYDSTEAEASTWLTYELAT